MSTPHEVDIAVVTQYIAEQSEPDNERYVFAYTITISNKGVHTCQLLRRHWLITDAAGEVEEVRGEGVIGQQPLLNSGESFEYTSGAVLKTPVGAMHGSYQFTTEDGQLFDVEIPAFSLSLPNLVH
ncbi:MAG: Co2+/Mg2+ efflux protein ApaG [Pseudomonadota bacterium]